METHKLNLDKSQSLYDRCGGEIYPKECYRNIFHTLPHLDKEHRIAYGYMQAAPNIYVRHCFLIDERGDVIDPTICCFEDKNAGVEYFSFSILTEDEYWELLKQNSFYPDLCNVLREKDNAAIHEGFKKGLLFIG